MGCTYSEPSGSEVGAVRPRRPDTAAAFTSLAISGQIGIDHHDHRRSAAAAPALLELRCPTASMSASTSRNPLLVAAPHDTVPQTHTPRRRARGPHHHHHTPHAQPQPVLSRSYSGIAHTQSTGGGASTTSDVILLNLPASASAASRSPRGANLNAAEVAANVAVVRTIRSLYDVTGRWGPLDRAPSAVEVRELGDAAVSLHESLRAETWSMREALQTDLESSSSMFIPDPTWSGSVLLSQGSVTFRSPQQAGLSLFAPSSASQSRPSPRGSDAPASSSAIPSPRAVRHVSITLPSSD
jgi:hypothetical protein